MKRKTILKLIENIINSHNTDLYKLIEIEALIGDNFKIRKNEDNHLLIDPKKHPITFSLKHK